MVKQLILNFFCPDRPGVQAQVTGLLYRHGVNLTDVASFSDLSRQLFFSRMVLSMPEGDEVMTAVQEGLRDLAQPLSLTWSLHAYRRRMPVIIAVSNMAIV
jgi:Formyltetrahydrofolate hydrolase